MDQPNQLGENILEGWAMAQNGQPDEPPLVLIKRKGDSLPIWHVPLVLIFFFQNNISSFFLTLSQFDMDMQKPKVGHCIIALH
jgi:hypothetical protein